MARRFQVLEGMHNENRMVSDGKGGLKREAHIYRSGMAKGPIVDADGKQAKSPDGKLLFEPGDVVEDPIAIDMVSRDKNKFRELLEGEPTPDPEKTKGQKLPSLHGAPSEHKRERKQ